MHLLIVYYLSPSVSSAHNAFLFLVDVNKVNISYILKMKYSNPFYILLILKTELIYRAWREEMNEPLFYVVIEYLIYTISSFPNPWVVIKFLATVTREVPLVEKELLFLLEKLCSSAESVTFVLLTLNYYSTWFLFKIVFVSFKRNMIWAASGTRTANFFAAPKFTPDF